MENAKKFFEELAKTEEAKALFESVETPETEEARIAAYIDIAGKLGLELTADEINAYFTANEVDLAEVSDKELEQLSGGSNIDTCGYLYQKIWAETWALYALKCAHMSTQAWVNHKVKSMGLE